MKKLLITALLALSTVAFAQEAAQQPGENVDSPSATGTTDQPHTGANEQEPAEDPSTHFNWAHDWFTFYGKDVYGGKLGDGKMVDEHGNVVMHEVEKVVPDPENPGKTKVVKEMEVAEEEGMSPPFLFMLLNFGILLFILAKGGAPFARKVAQDRHDQIKTALEEAERLRDQAEKKLAEYETRIKDVDAEVKKLVDGIRADADADKARILEAAAKQAEQMKRDAEARIAAEIELARAQLRKEVAIAASGATEKILREKMTQDDQTKLVSTFIGNVQSSTGKEAR
jgi:F-type H+-transporting ATPase subunit b